MALFDKLKSIAGGSEDKEFRYRCGKCTHEFTAQASHPQAVRCPACGSDRIHSPL